MSSFIERFIPASVEHRFLKIINNYFIKYTKGENRPVFYDEKETCPELLEFDANFQIIQNELKEILYRKNNIPKYYEIDEIQTYISGHIKEDVNDSWRVFMLYLMGKNLKENQLKCPETTKILKKIPNLFQAFFSVLEGGKSILSHEGPFLGYIRYHIGAITPKNNPPYIKILDETHTWEEGKSMIFDDTLRHEVINNSDDIRVVLIVDILRPMPFVPHVVNWLVTLILIKNIYGRKLVNNLNKFKKRVEKKQVAVAPEE